MESATTQPIRSHTRLSPPTILVVDDEAPIRELIEYTLTDDGYQVLTAASGFEALALAYQYSTHITLVLTDYLMPGINGLDLARRMEADPYLTDIPRVLMSVTPPPDTSLFRATIAKPFFLDTVLTYVHSYQRVVPLNDPEHLHSRHR